MAEGGNPKDGGGGPRPLLVLLGAPAFPAVLSAAFWMILLPALLHPFHVGALPPLLAGALVHLVLVLSVRKDASPRLDWISSPQEFGRELHRRREEKGGVPVRASSAESPVESVEGAELWGGRLEALASSSSDPTVAMALADAAVLWRAILRADASAEGARDLSCWHLPRFAALAEELEESMAVPSRAQGEVEAAALARSALMALPELLRSRLGSIRGGGLAADAELLRAVSRQESRPPDESV